MSGRAMGIAEASIVSFDIGPLLTFSPRNEVDRIVEKKAHLFSEISRRVNIFCW